MNNHNRILKNFITIIMLVCFVIDGIGIHNIARAADNEWGTEDFKLPVALRAACVEYADDKMYVIGGDKGSHSLVDTVYIYDYKTKTWNNGSPMPQPRAFATSIILDGKVYIIGGHKVVTNKYYSVDDVYIYDIKTDTWTIGQSMPKLTVYAESIVYNNKIYVFGGANATTGQTPHTYHKNIQIYDIMSNSWTLNSNMPFERYRHTINLIEDKVYLIGGYNGSNYCNNVEIYDLTSETWSEGFKMNNSKGLSSSIVYNDKIYVFGGDNNQNLFNSSEVYDVVTDTWSNGNNIITAKRLSDSIVVNNKIYLIGGETNVSSVTTTDTIESLQLPPADNRLFAHLYMNEKTKLSFSHDLTDNQNLTWKSSDTRVATVDNNGIITALETGTAYISAYNQNGTYLDYIPVKVTENDVYRMAIHLNSGQKQKLYFKGNPNNITWSSMDNSVATVSTNGEVTGISKGLVIVKAEWNGEEHYIYVRVN